MVKQRIGMLAGLLGTLSVASGCGETGPATRLDGGSDDRGALDGGDDGLIDATPPDGSADGPDAQPAAPAAYTAHFGTLGTLPGVQWVRGQADGNSLGAQMSGAGEIALDAATSEAVSNVPAIGSFRVEMVFRTNAHGRGDDAGSGTLMSRGTDATDGWRIAVENGRVRAAFWNAGPVNQTVLDGRTAVSDGRWHRLMAVRDGDHRAIKLVVDGIDVATTPDGTTGNTSSEPIRVGNDAAGHHLWGVIDDGFAITHANIADPASGVARVRSTPFLAGAVGVPPARDIPPGKVYAAFRIPALVRAPDGTLVALVDGRVWNAVCDFSNIDILVARSTDNGTTWTRPTVLFDNGSDRVSNQIPFLTNHVVDGRHRIVVLATKSPVAPARTSFGANCSTFEFCSECVLGASPHQTVVLRYSDDYGATWSGEMDITSSVVDTAHWESIQMGPAHGVVTDHPGPHQDNLFVAAEWEASDGAHEKGSVMLVGSSDGLHWSRYATPTGGLVNNESAIAELSTGHLMINARYQYPGVPDAAARMAGLRVLGFFDPTADTPAWQGLPGAFDRIATFRGPVVEGSLLSRDGTARQGDERRTFFAFPAGEYGGPQDERHDLRVYQSSNDGATWSMGRRVASGFAAYSDMAPGNNGTIGILSEQQIVPDTRYHSGHVGYHRVDYLSVPVAYLDQSSVLSFGFEERAPGDAFGAGFPSAGIPYTRAGASLVLGPDGTTGQTLTAGQFNSTAVTFNGTNRACVAAADASGWLDFGRRDGFGLEVLFRTSQHGATSAGPGTLASKASGADGGKYYLRVESGRVRFTVGSCDIDMSSCGIMPGACTETPTTSGCSEQTIWSPADVNVSNNAWWRAYAERDYRANVLRLILTDAAGTSYTTTAPIDHPWAWVANDSRFCVGSLDGGQASFIGSIDHVGVWSDH